MGLLFALCAAWCYAIGCVLQQRAAQQAPAGLSFSPALLVHLARRPLWLLGIGTMIGGNVLQALALGTGSLAQVEPALAATLLFALLFGAALTRRSPRRRDWYAAAAVSTGLAGLIVLGAPADGRSQPSVGTWIAALVAAAGVTLLGVFLGKRWNGAVRAALLAAVAGALFGLQDALTKTVLRLANGGIGAVLQTWEPYVVVAIALVGLLLAQTAYKAAPLKASLPALTIAEPVVGTLIGILALGERLHTDTLALATLASAGLLAMVGAHVLARSPLVHAESRAPAGPLVADPLSAQPLVAPPLSAPPLSAQPLSAHPLGGEG